VQSVILRLTPAPRRLSSVTARALGFSAAVAGHAFIWAAYCWSPSSERLADRSSDRSSPSLLTVSVSLLGTKPEPPAALSAVAPRLIEPSRSDTTSLQSLAKLQIAPGYTAAAPMSVITIHTKLEETIAVPSPAADESHSATPQSETATHGSSAAPVRRLPRRAEPLPGQSLPLYPESAREDGLEGLVVLSVEVDADGHVLAVTWTRRSGVPVLDYAAKQAILRWRFQPANDGLGPIAGRARVSVRFSLRAAQAVAIAQVQP
jgi:TonB family protein